MDAIELEYRTTSTSMAGYSAVDEFFNSLGEQFLAVLSDPRRSFQFEKHLKPDEGKRFRKYMVSLWEEIVAGRVRTEVVRDALKDYLKNTRFQPDSPIAELLEKFGMGIKDAQGVRIADEHIEAICDVQYRRFLSRVNSERRRRGAKALAETVNPHHAAQVLSSATNPEGLANTFLTLAIYDLHRALVNILSRPQRRGGRAQSVHVLTVDEDPTNSISFVLSEDGPAKVVPEKARKGFVTLVLRSAEEVRTSLGIAPDIPEAEMVRAAEKALAEGRDPDVEKKPLPYKAPGL